MYNSLWSHRLKHARFPCPSLSPGISTHSCLFSHWCHPTILSSVTSFSSCSQSFPASGSFPMSWFFLAYYVIRKTPFLQPLCIKEALLFPAPFYRWEHRGWRGTCHFSAQVKEVWLELLAPVPELWVMAQHCFWIECWMEEWVRP